MSSRNSLIHPGLWTKRKQLPDIKQQLRSKIPLLTYIDVRRARVPLYEALLKELLEEGYVLTADHLIRLTTLEKKLLQEGIIRKTVMESKMFVLSLAKYSKLAESLKVLHGKSREAHEIILTMALSAKEQGREFSWLTEQLFHIALDFSKKYSDSSLEMECRIRYYYAKFLSEDVKLYEDAINEFAKASELCESKNWRISEKYNDANLFTAICTDYHTALLNGAQKLSLSLSKENLKLAEHFLKIAVDIASYCETKGNLCWTILKRCDLLIQLKSFNLALSLMKKSRVYALTLQDVDLDCEIYLKTALCHYKLKHSESSENLLNEALEWTRKNSLLKCETKCHLLLGKIYLNHYNNSMKAQEYFKDAILVSNACLDVDLINEAKYFYAISKANRILPHLVDVLNNAEKSEDFSEKFQSSFGKWREQRYSNWQENFVNQFRFPFQSQENIFGKIRQISMLYDKDQVLINTNWVEKYESQSWHSFGAVENVQDDENEEKDIFTEKVEETLRDMNTKSSEEKLRESLAVYL